MRPWDEYLTAYDWDLPPNRRMRTLERQDDGTWKILADRNGPRIRDIWLKARVRLKLDSGETVIGVLPDQSAPVHWTVTDACLWPRSFARVPQTLLNDVVRPRLRAMALMGRRPETDDPALVARVAALEERAARGKAAWCNLEALRMHAIHPETIGTAWEISTPAINWSSWSSMPRGNALVNGRDIETASVDELFAIMTSWVRYFRHVMSALDPFHPIVRAVAQRAAVILGELDCGLPHPSEVFAIHDDTVPSAPRGDGVESHGWCG
jgi:hypothetical protein